MILTKFFVSPITTSGFQNFYVTNMIDKFSNKDFWSKNKLVINFKIFSLDLEGSGDKAVTDKIQHFHVRRLESMRFWLMHAVGSIHAYLSGQVLQSLGSTLEKALAQAENLEAIITSI